MLAHAFSTVFLALALQLPGSTGSVRGEIRSEESGAVIPGATVEIVADRPLGATASDDDGRYLLSNVPAGRHTIRAHRIGYAPLEMDVMIPAGGQVEVDIALRMTPIVLAPVEVGGRERSIRGDSLAAPPGELTMAGVRAMQASPGLAELGLADAVSRLPGQEPPDPSDVLYVRGTGADLKLVYLDGAPVYAPFPLGGLLDPFAPGLLSSAEVYLGGAPARYDGGLSYILDLRTRAARGGRFHSSGAMDLLSSRALVEIPVGGNAGLLFSGRGVHDVGTRWFEEGALPYGYREGLMRADVGLGGTGSLSLTAFANGERVWLDSVRTASTAIEWGNQAASLRYRASLGGTSVELTGAVADFEAQLPVSDGTLRLARGSSRRTRLAADAVSRLSGIVLRYGASFEEQDQRYEARVADLTGSWKEVGSAGEGSEAGLYLDAGVQLAPRFVLRGGLRADHFSLSDEFILSPRVAATMMLTDRASVTLAAGQYHQYLRPPEEKVLAAAGGIPIQQVEPLALGRATHVSLSVDQDVGEGIHFGLEGFYKNFEGIPNGVASNASSSGVDLWLRRGTGNWRGWLGYSLAWTWSTSDVDNATRFDGRHLLSSGISAPLGERARIDLGFTYGAGLPYSAIPFGTTDMGESPFGEYAPAFAVGRSAVEMTAGNAPLLPTPSRPYLRVDLGASGTWTPRWGRSMMEITPYVRLLNTLGHRDALFYRAPENGDDGFRPVMVLPLVPVIGVEWNF